ncbi:hypothetical protein CRV08_09310 [Halarcobacter ebronensis]|uniref:GGDEF domain-containing protein n=1 Tax=Halarcobacter ebronensis TaxID=1462615 RepID=A0A4Q0YC98_9BACT|nr:GGDEF domain-containing phosphodiesterase [Halarcobacter ebronensis]RXJ67996.1 hypothetical protein CRV08_09310 [Halarcobacter ebronensis]
MISKFKDELILLLSILIIIPILTSINIFELLYAFSREYERYQVDELLIIVLAILLCLSIYSFKKTFDLKKTKNVLFNYSEKDMLTSLKNRNAFFKIPEEDKKYLVLINIIDFTIFNKHLGFKKADQLLKKAAITLNKILEKKLGEELYRIYGDEFAFYCDCENIEKVLESIKNRFEKKLFGIEGYKFYIHLNLAYSSTSPKYLTSCEALLSTRKSIVKSIKEYSKENEISCNNSLDMLNTIRISLENSQVIPVYQGIYDNNTNTTYKYETLARIKKDGKLISPYEFIDISKRFKLYHKITHRIIENAFDDFKDSQCEFSINLSYIDIVNENTCNFIFSMLKKNPQIAKRLTIEFLETENISDYDLLIEFTKKIKEYGTKVALDDFGAGYSNWNNIIKLKPNYIKIDGSIIQNLIGNDKNINFIKLIVEFSRMNEIKTIAEYVDSQELANLIKELKIDYSQGFLFAQPQERTLIKL